MNHIDGMDRDYKIISVEYKRITHLYNHKEEKTVETLEYQIIKVNGNKQECEKLMKDDPKCGDIIVMKDGIVVDIELFSRYFGEIKYCISNLLKDPRKYDESLTDIKTKIEEIKELMNLIYENPHLEKKYEYLKGYKKQLLIKKKDIENEITNNILKVDVLLCTLSVKTFIDSHTFISVEY